MKIFLLAAALSLSARAAAPVTTLGNFPNSMIYAVETDATGNIYVAGFQGNFDQADPFVAKLSSTGTTLYSTTLAGSNFGIAWAIAVDPSGAVYIFGNTNSPDFPVTPGALQTTMQGTFQGFVTKLDPNGKIVYSTFIGGATDVTPGLTSAPGLDSILVDSDGDAIITGQAGANATIPMFPPAPAPVVKQLGILRVETRPGRVENPRRDQWRRRHDRNGRSE
jgi:outer membrane protein assembly factor BamB